jgi:hypothetical protein
MPLTIKVGGRSCEGLRVELMATSKPLEAGILKKEHLTNYMRNLISAISIGLLLISSLK